MFNCWLKYRIQWYMKKIFKSYDKNKFNGKKIINFEESNEEIAKMIKSNKPFCLLRFGFAEFSYVYNNLTFGKLIENEKKFENNKQKAMRDIFRNTEERYKYSKMVLDDCYDADIKAVWDILTMEDYIVNKYCDKPVIIDAVHIEPLCCKIPWTLALEGKKVLVISPFSEAIKDQYSKINLVYSKKKMWPEMDLKTMKSIWYMGNEDNSGFGSWFEAYDYLYEDAMKIDFDIVILSCGPFGFNLASRFKKAGKQAIHFGGALQMLFGIMGSRWDESAAYKEFVNKYWIRAPKTEKPSQTAKLDGSCYW